MLIQYLHQALVAAAFISLQTTRSYISEVPIHTLHTTHYGETPA